MTLVDYDPLSPPAWGGFIRIWFAHIRSRTTRSDLPRHPKGRTMTLRERLAAWLSCLAAGAVLAASPAAALADQGPNDNLEQAEKFLAPARQGQLTNDMAESAAGLMDAPEPFVRGIAEWAIATKIERENGGEQVVWPGPSPPGWFARWRGQAGAGTLDADYVRQAVSWDIHHDTAALRSSLEKIRQPAVDAGQELLRSGDDAQRAAGPAAGRTRPAAAGV